jgi:hypothetical protein
MCIMKRGGRGTTHYARYHSNGQQSVGKITKK